MKSSFISPTMKTVFVTTSDSFLETSFSDMLSTLTNVSSVSLSILNAYRARLLAMPFYSKYKNNILKVIDNLIHVFTFIPINVEAIFNPVQLSLITFMAIDDQYKNYLNGLTSGNEFDLPTKAILDGIRAIMVQFNITSI